MRASTQIILNFQGLFLTKKDMVKRLLILTLALLAVAVGTIAVALNIRSSRGTANEKNTQTIREAGVMFSVPEDVSVTTLPSTTDAYKNFSLAVTQNLGSAGNPSGVSVGIPVKQGSDFQSLEDSIRPFADTPVFSDVLVNGLRARQVVYRTKPIEGDAFFPSEVTELEFPSSFPGQPVHVSYNHGDGNDSLEVTWDMIRQTLTIE